MFEGKSDLLAVHVNRRGLRLGPNRREICANFGKFARSSEYRSVRLVSGSSLRSQKKKKTREILQSLALDQSTCRHGRLFKSITLTREGGKKILDTSLITVSWLACC